MEKTSKYWYFVGRPCGMQKRILSFLDETKQKYTTVDGSAGSYLPDSSDVNNVTSQGYTPVYVLLDGYQPECGVWVDSATPIETVKQLSGYQSDKEDYAVCLYEQSEEKIDGLYTLVRMGWGKSELAELTRFCRQAQGVTEEQEKLTERAIRHCESTHGLFIVYLPHEHVSTVIDRLFWQGQFPSILTITPKEVFYCGFYDIIYDILDFIHQELLIDINDVGIVNEGNGTLSISRKWLNSEGIDRLVRQFKRLSRDKFGALM